MNHGKCKLYKIKLKKIKYSNLESLLKNNLNDTILYLAKKINQKLSTNVIKILKLSKPTKYIYIYKNHNFAFCQ